MSLTWIVATALTVLVVLVAIGVYQAITAHKQLEKNISMIDSIIYAAVENERFLIEDLEQIKELCPDKYYYVYSTKYCRLVIERINNPINN